MKTVLATLLVCAFLQMVWVSVSTDEAVDCTKLFANSSVCCEGGNGSCAFYTCSEGTPAKCMDVNISITAVCPGQEKATQVCNGSSTPTPIKSCADYKKNTSECCANGCGFFTCNTTAASYEVCALKNATDVCKQGETQSTDTCVPTTPVVPTVPTTTAAPEPKTCADHKDNKTACCASACFFYNCTDSANVTKSTVCSNETALDKICSAGYTTVPVSCSVSPITSPQTPTTSEATTSKQTTPTPTKSPSTSGGGGRHFDGASFIGGIVLCAGIVAIACFGFKFYKSRQERNYHTL